jgi:hydroxymethylbilane synthase
MGYDEMIVEKLSLDEFTPAVGQGSVAIEVSKSLDEMLKKQVIDACNHTQTEIKLRAERAYLRVLEGGCSIPVFALATIKGDQISLKGGIVSLDGGKRISIEVKGDKQNPEAIGEKLAEEVFAAGGKTILDQIKSTLNK